MCSSAAPGTGFGVKIAKHILKKRGGSLRPTILVLSVVLGLVPLAGVVWIVASGMITLTFPFFTVDGLFMSLILLTLAGCLLPNVYWEMRDHGLIGKKDAAPAKVPAAKAS
jgi:hypothetical protein